MATRNSTVECSAAASLTHACCLQLQQAGYRSPHHASPPPLLPTTTVHKHKRTTITPVYILSLQGYYVPESWDVYWTIRSACHMAYKHMGPQQHVNCIPGISAMSLKRTFVTTWQQVRRGGMLCGSCMCWSCVGGNKLVP